MLRRAEPLQRSPIAHWRAGAGAAVYVGDTNIFYVDNHLSLILHNTNGTLQFMQRERRHSTKKMTRLHYNKLRLDRRKSNACQIFTGKAFHKSRVSFSNARRNLSFYYIIIIHHELSLLHNFIFLIIQSPIIINKHQLVFVDHFMKI